MPTKIDAEARWHYNALDVAATIGAYRALQPLLDKSSGMVYRAQMALEACCLAVQSRGIKVDLNARKRLKLDMNAELEGIKIKLAQIAAGPVNPNSSPQTKELFYDLLQLKPQRSKSTGKVGVDGAILERIAKGTVPLAVKLERGGKPLRLDRAARLAQLFLKYREIKKDLSMIEAKLDHGRIRTSYGVGGTKSFRFSASKTCFNTGANLQQLKKELRIMLVPDEGMDILQGDQDRAESYVVAYRSGDENYIKAHNEGDTHLEVAKLIWRDQPWTGVFTEDLALATRPKFIGRFSMRDMSKRVQHASNYMAPPHTLSRLLSIKLKEAREIQEAYFAAFPGIKEWQQEVIEEVKRYKSIRYPGGFRREFFGRTWEESVHREAISSIPQAVIGWNNHIAFFRMWKELEEPGEFEVLHHNHDAVIVQCREGTWETKWKSEVEKLTKIHWPGKYEDFIVPWTWDLGKNWKEAS